MANKSILLETEGNIARLTLNRPERLNAIDIPALEELISSLEEVGKDEAVHALILGGNGKVFCAGADHSEMVPRDPLEWQRIVDRYLEPVRLITSMDKVVIARIHGDAVGGGLGIALACDFRIMASTARLCAPFVKIGLAGCDMSAGYFLPRIIGLGRATDLMMTGRFVTASEAVRIGLVHRSTPDEELDSAVNELAGELAKGPPVALAMTKRAIRRSLDRDMDAEFDYEIFVQTQCLQSEDHREGIKAFQEKRKPEYKGK